jgi:hypothetical protein
MIKNLYDKLFKCIDEVDIEIMNIDENENKAQMVEGNIKEVIELQTFLQSI